MSTRSDIIVHRTDGKWHRVYCHWDGYLSHNGEILFTHYNSQDGAEALIKHGNLSSLAQRCDKPSGHSFTNPAQGCCVYYGRDRGERDQDGLIADSLKNAWPAKDTWTEFTYVWDSGAWYVADPDEGPSNGQLILLSDALTGKKTIHPKIKAFGLTFGRHA